MRAVPTGRSTLVGLLRLGWVPLGAAALTTLFLACGGDDTPHPAFPVDDSGSTGDVAADSHDAADATHADADADATETSPDSADAADALAVDDGALEAAIDAGGDADAADAADAVIYGGMCGDAGTEAGAPTGSCGAVVQTFPDEGHTHVDVGSTVAYCTMPPNSGPHFVLWAHYLTYDTPVPWSYLVHDMEHGAVLVLYKCAGSCPAVAAQLQAVIDARPVDPLCDPDAGISRRVILAPAPDLDVPVAAAAWQWTYKASCVDAASLGAFIDAHYAMAAENFCGDGQYP